MHGRLHVDAGCVGQAPEAYEAFKDDTSTLLGASELRVLSAVPADVDQYTSLVVDESTTVYMKLAVRVPA